MNRLDRNAKESAEWFLDKINNGFQVLTIRDYELQMIKTMCKQILRKKRKPKLSAEGEK